MRDYVKEYQWQLKKYDLIKVKVDKNLGKKFREKLKKENITMAKWLKDRISEYVDKKL